MNQQQLLAVIGSLYVQVLALQAKVRELTAPVATTTEPPKTE